MIECAINNIEVIQEIILNDRIQNHCKSDVKHQISEIDLSFCDALASKCSGENSSGPVSRPFNHII